MNRINWRVSTLLPTAMWLVSCASYQDIQSREPVYRGESVKTPAEFAACAMPGLLGVSGHSRVVPDGNRLVLLSNVGSSDTLFFTITVTPTATRTLVEMRQILSIRTFTEVWDAARPCL